jgi:flagellar biosynthetic protein FlhB
MAEEGDSGEKSEDPTSRRLSESRQDGMIAHSRDLSNVLGMTAAVVALEFLAPKLWETLQIITIGSFTSNLFQETLELTVLHQQFIALLWLLIPVVLFMIAIAAICGAGASAMQTRFLWSNKLLRPKFNILNPVSGLKKIFGTSGLFQTAKSIAKLCIICPIAYTSFFELFPRLIGIMDIPLEEILPFTAYAANFMFWKIIAWLLLLAIVDYIWQRYQTKKKLMMSKQEIKEERKATDGDEKTKRQMRVKALQKMRDRMFQQIPTADVVVTNPTHFAVALRYSMETGSAPTVVAKGRGFVAKRIRESAARHGIPVIERKSLARALFKAVEVGQEIPFDLYQAVAEILAYVYRIKGKTVRKKPKKSPAHQG